MKQKLFNTGLAAICCILIALPDAETKGKRQPVKQQERNIKPVQVDTGTAGEQDSSPAQRLLIP